MAEQHPAMTFLLAAHERAERLANASDGGKWAVAERAGCDCCDVVRNETGGLVTNADLDDAPLIAEHANPRAVLLRVAAERDILAEHEARPGLGSVDEGWLHTPSFVCAICAPAWFQGHPQRAPWPCRTVLGLAKAWGWEETT